MPDLYFNEESGYSEENRSENEVFALPFFKNFSLILSREKRVVMRAIRKKLRKQSFADILQNRSS